MNQSSFNDITGQLENHIQDVAALMRMLEPFHQAREETYQLSFARRGEVGVWFNLARKYDRLDPLAGRVSTQVVTGEEVENNDGVTLVDTLVDTAMYALKWIAIIRVLRPEHFEKWVEQVYCRDTGMTVEEAFDKLKALTLSAEFIGLDKLLSDSYTDQFYPGEIVDALEINWNKHPVEEAKILAKVKAAMGAMAAVDAEEKLESVHLDDHNNEVVIVVYPFIVPDVYKAVRHYHDGYIGKDGTQPVSSRYEKQLADLLLHYEYVKLENWKELLEDYRNTKVIHTFMNDAGYIEWLQNKLIKECETDA